MLSQKFDAPLRIELGASRRMFLIIAGVHILALTAVLISSVPVGLQGGIIVLLGLQLHISLYLVRRAHGHRLLRGFWPRIQLVEWSNHTQWSLTLENGASLAAELLPSTVCHPKLIVLNFYVSDAPWYARRRFVLLIPEDIGRTRHRRLRVLLRFLPFERRRLLVWKS